MCRTFSKTPAAMLARPINSWRSSSTNRNPGSVASRYRTPKKCSGSETGTAASARTRADTRLSAVRSVVAFLQVVGKNGRFVAADVGHHGPAHPQRRRRAAGDPIPMRGGDEVRAFARDEEGPALRGNRLEGEPDQLLAELGDRADRREGPARREQDLQVEGDPSLRRRGCRGLDRARLQVTRLRRREPHRRAEAEFVDPELRRAEAMPIVGGSEQEEELGGSNLDLVPMLEDAELDRHSVDEGPVHALQIGDLVGLARSCQESVPSGGGRVRDRKRVRRIAPDRHFVRFERMHGTLKWPCDGHQPRHDGSHCGESYLNG